MEILSPASGSPPTDIPEAGNDPGDPLRPEIEEENSTPNPPAANPSLDMELTGSNEVDKDDFSDNESVLSEIDEAQFEDFDPANIAIEDRPAIAVDESNVNLIGVHKRKRAEDGEGGAKKKKERRREKPKKKLKRRTDEDNFSGGEELEGKRSRRKKEGRPMRESPIEEDANLTPEERRKRALDKAMDNALKRPGKARKKRGEIDLDNSVDAEIETMRSLMSEAAQADTNARDQGLPAMAKLKLLPEVVKLLNRSSVQNYIVDPDLNLLQAVRFFLEPLNDGSLPAYNIQRELFTVLGKLPINKDSLVASGIGKVVLFYTKSNRPELGIKRQAERLMADWTRPILKRTDDYRKRDVVQVEYDPTRLPLRTSQNVSSQVSSAAARERVLAAPARYNRARIEGGPVSYTIAPRSNVQPQEMPNAPGIGGDDAFRRMKAKQFGKSGGRR